MGSDGVERASITIDAPIDVVWSVFTDVERWPTWASSFTSVELVDGPMRLGAKARIRQPRLPTVVWEVTKWEPGRSWTWAATGPGARTEASHVLTVSGGGTRRRTVDHLVGSDRTAARVRVALADAALPRHRSGRTEATQRTGRRGVQSRNRAQAR